MSNRVMGVVIKAIYAVMALVVLPIIVIDLVGIVYLEAGGRAFPPFIVMVMSPAVSFPALICGVLFALHVYALGVLRYG